MTQPIAPAITELLLDALKLRDQGDIAEALTKFQLAHREAKRIRDARGEASALLYSGGILRRFYKAKLRQARKQLDEGLRIFHRLKYANGIANALVELGTLDYQEGKSASSERHLREAARLFGELQDRAGQAKVLHQLGLLERHRQNHVAAEQYWREALLIFDGLHDEQGMGTVLLSLGGSQLFHHNSREQAKLTWEQALRLLEKAGDVFQAQRARQNLEQLAKDQHHENY